MNNEEAVPETNGVAVKLLAMVDLGPELEGLAGRQLRMRLVTFEPGGVFGPMHDHKGRPGTVYILQGTIMRPSTWSRHGLWARMRAGPRIGTPHIGSRIEEPLRRWRYGQHGEHKGNQGSFHQRGNDPYLATP